MSGDLWQLTVLTGSGSILTEQLTRELRAHLTTNGVQARHGTPDALPAGHKGGITQELVLLAGTAVSTGSARVLTTLIREWCSLDRRRRVEVRLGDSALVIEGNPKDQLTIIEKFLDEVGEGPGDPSNPVNQESNQ